MYLITNKPEEQNWSESSYLFKQRHTGKYSLCLEKEITRIKTCFAYRNRGYCRFIFKQNVSGVCDLSSDVSFQW